MKKITMLDGVSVRQKSELDVAAEIEKSVNANSVEVVWNGSLEKLYFPNVRENLLRPKVKNQLLWGLNRKTLTDKNVDFLEWSGEVITDMENTHRLKKIPIISKLIDLEPLWDWLVLLLAIIIQIWLLVDLEDYGMSGLVCGEGNLTDMVSIPNTPGGGDSQSVCVSNTFEEAHDIIGALHLASTLLLALTYLLTNFHRFTHPQFNYLAFIFGKDSKRAEQYKPKPRRMQIAWTSAYNVWLMVMIVCSALGIYFHGEFFCVHLMHILVMFDLLTRVIRGATANRGQLLVIFPFAIFIIYIWSMMYFFLTREMFRSSDMEYCNSLWQCFSTALRYSLRASNGGHNYKWTDKRDFSDMWLRIFLDSTFWISYTIIGLKVVTALILDGFTSQKKIRESSLEEMNSVCTICGLTKDDLASEGIDWDMHKKKDHSMWSYIKLFYYLKKNHKATNSKLSAIEMEILQKFDSRDVSFLPRKTSLSWRNAIKIKEERKRKNRFQ